MGADEGHPSSSADIGGGHLTHKQWEDATNFTVPGEGPYFGLLLVESTF